MPVLITSRGPFDDWLSFLPDGIGAREAWFTRSSMVLGHYFDEHERTLEDFQLERPLRVSEVKDFVLNRWEDVLPNRTEVAPKVTDEWPWIGTRRFPSTYDPAVNLHERARHISGELGCSITDVELFLFTGRAFNLPWLQIRRGFALQSLGLTFDIHVGTSDVTAEDVRSAYNIAKQHFLGGERNKALPDHVFALILLDGAGRRKGWTRRERHERWLDYAQDWNLRGREGELLYHTLASYDNYIKKLRKTHDWIDFELEQGGYDPADSKGGETHNE